jgi:hypothetical protein
VQVKENMSAIASCSTGLAGAIVALVLSGCGHVPGHVVVSAFSATGMTVQLDSASTDIVFADTWSGESIALKQALRRDDMKEPLNRRRVVFVFSPDDRSEGQELLPNAAPWGEPNSPLFRLRFVDDLNAEWAIAPRLAKMKLPAVLVGSRYLTVEEWLRELGLSSDAIAAILPYRKRAAAPPIMARAVSGAKFPIDPANADIIVGGTWCPHTAELKEALQHPEFQPYVAQRNIFFLFEPDDLDYVLSQLDDLEKTGTYSHEQVAAIRASLQQRRESSQLFDPDFTDDLDGRWGIGRTPRKVSGFPTILAGDRYMDTKQWLEDELHVPDSTIYEVYKEIQKNQH